MPEDIQIISVPDCVAVYASYEGSGGKLPALWRDLMFHAGRAGLLKPWPTLLGLVYEEPRLTGDSAHLRYDACILLSDAGTSVPTALRTKKIEGGQFVTARHSGSHEDRGRFCDYLARTWMPENGVRHRAGPHHEYYESSLLELMRGRFRTRVCIPADCS